MARRTEDVVFEVSGQVLLYRVPQGRPVSATFEVFDDAMGDDGVPEFIGAATVDAVNTTVAAASGPGQSDPRRLNLTSTAGIVVGRKYLLSESQLREWVEPVMVGSGFVRMRDRLQNDFTTAATLQSTYVLAAVDAAWVADSGNLSDLSDPNPDYRVRWSVDVSGSIQIAYSYFDLVRAPFLHSVDVNDLVARFPGLAEGLMTGDRLDQGRRIIDDAWRVVRGELAALRLNDTAILEDEALDEAVLRAALVQLAEAGIHPRSFTATEYVTLTRANYDRHVDQHFRVSLRPPVAEGSDSSAANRAAAPFWEK